jgi:hypothetical protein
MAVPGCLPAEKPICGGLYLSLGIPRILVNRGGVSADGTFSIVLVKHNVRTPRAARCWSGIIAAKAKAEKISSEQRSAVLGKSSSAMSRRAVFAPSPQIKLFAILNRLRNRA